jgi:hypothetical protein
MVRAHELTVKLFVVESRPVEEDFKAPANIFTLRTNLEVKHKGEHHG